MSAFVLDKAEIELLTKATAAALQLNRKYAGSYPLDVKTVDLLGKYTDDLHNLYRALYIMNIKAVNGRYNESAKTLPKYTSIAPWDISRLNPAQLKKAAGMFGCYMYQCSEDPIYGSPVFNAFYDVYKLVCLILVHETVGWNGENR